MYHAAELVHWMRNQDSKILLPAQVDIDLTNICNQDCYYCNSAEHRAAAPVQKHWSQYITLLDKVATWRCHSPNSIGTTHTVTFPGGGEPTILPGYEKVIEHAIDLGFLTSITTNGSKLDKLSNISADKLKKLSWIGIDIDAGTEDLYEIIRRSLTKSSLFHKVSENAKYLIDLGVNVDFKVLINPYNDNQKAIIDIFNHVMGLGGRKVYFRPVIYQGKAHEISLQTRAWIRQASEATTLPFQINDAKTAARKYTRCHQMFHFPVFCADGNIYLCCDNKGNAQFSLGRWDQGDFRDIWQTQHHHDIYQSINTAFCAPCRPNAMNNAIQESPFSNNPI